jgi:hypothetical protein
MNYIEGAELKQIPDSEFIPEYNRQMPHATWQEAVQPKIHQLILQVFQAAKATKNGIRHLPNGRAIYGTASVVVDLVSACAGNSRGSGSHVYFSLPTLQAST